jgi:hypothetical protein
MLILPLPPLKQNLNFYPVLKIWILLCSWLLRVSGQVPTLAKSCCSEVASIMLIYFLLSVAVWAGPWTLIIDQIWNKWVDPHCHTGSTKPNWRTKILRRQLNVMGPICSIPFHLVWNDRIVLEIRFPF